MKVEHAQTHVGHVGEVRCEYLQRRPWELLPEETVEPFTTNLRLRVLELPSAGVVLGVGDVLHNLSSALDALAFALARRTYGPGLDEDEGLQAVTEFPVKHSSEAMSQWANQRGRGALYAATDVEAMWRAQSYYWTALAWSESQIGPEPGTPAAEARRLRDPLARLRRLHNIDKHRRLHVALLGPDVPSYGSTAPAPRRVRVTGIWEDLATLGQNPTYRPTRPPHP